MECRKGAALVCGIATHWLEWENLIFAVFKSLLRRTHRTYPQGMYRSAPLEYLGLLSQFSSVSFIAFDSAC